MLLVFIFKSKEPFHLYIYYMLRSKNSHNKMVSHTMSILELLKLRVCATSSPVCDSLMTLSHLHNFRSVRFGGVELAKEKTKLKKHPFSCLRDWSVRVSEK